MYLKWLEGKGEFNDQKKPEKSQYDKEGKGAHTYNENCPPHSIGRRRLLGSRVNSLKLTSVAVGAHSYPPLRTTKNQIRNTLLA